MMVQWNPPKMSAWPIVMKSVAAVPPRATPCHPVPPRAHRWLHSFCHGTCIVDGRSPARCGGAPRSEDREAKRTFFSVNVLMLNVFDTVQTRFLTLWFECSDLFGSARNIYLVKMEVSWNRGTLKLSELDHSNKFSTETHGFGDSS